ncbi:hypothetical protein L3X38_023710 [Prunus dulcis]|uniref:Uncharacterized protein n=1 Tax=Prunus dulcis TaxID=3755 RepID=A0AAD4Z6B1_PRUDU|nr:hypothetical protein L3X38_023710 [Prunus dulcis]
MRHHVSNPGQRSKRKRSSSKELSPRLGGRKKQKSVSSVEPRLERKVGPSNLGWPEGKVGSSYSELQCYSVRRYSVRRYRVLDPTGAYPQPELEVQAKDQRYPEERKRRKRLILLSCKFRTLIPIRRLQSFQQLFLGKAARLILL